MANNLDSWTSELFFNRLKYFLHKRGMSLYQLSLTANINADTLYKMRKRHTLPNLQTVCLLCDALEISLTDFFIMPHDNQAYSHLLQQINSLSEELLNLISQLSPYKNSVSNLDNPV